MPQSVKDQANTQLAAGAPFISNAQVEASLTEAGVPATSRKRSLTRTRTSQIAGLRAALSMLAVLGVISLFFTGRIPKVQPGSESAEPDTA